MTGQNILMTLKCNIHVLFSISKEIKIDLNLSAIYTVRLDLPVTKGKNPQKSSNHVTVPLRVNDALTKL